MIDKESFSLQWVQGLRSRLGKRIDPKMIEKVVNALALLEQLSSEGLALVFKGGTCLLLTTKEPQRFSIDVDILTEQSENEIISVLKKVIKNEPFTRWESDNNRKTTQEAPVSHYKIYYTSKIDNSFGEEPILLDVLHTANYYPKIIDYPIEHPWLKQINSPVTIKVPIHDCILGDKLTAFAPNTTGILYTKERPVEIIKQLYDINVLIDQVEDIDLVKESYQRIVNEEITYRKLNIPYEQVLDDTIETCLVLAARNQNSYEFRQLHTGITNITNFIINRFKIEEAVIAAGKVAYLCLLLKLEKSPIPEKYTSSTQIRDVLISNNRFQWLNKLKKSNPTAFFYWEKAIALKS